MKTEAKKESLALYVVRLAVTLLVITAVVAAALAGVNSITAPAIAALNEAKTQEAIEAVLPGGGQKIDAPAVSMGVPVAAVYRGENGYAVQVAPSGFDGEIDMMVGIDAEGKVVAISIINHTETAGLGAVAAAKTSAGEAFRGQFAGLSGSAGTEKRGTGTLDAITGATITSEAVCTGVNAALAIVAQLG
jgi:electron transport complex protein RnfG